MLEKPREATEGADGSEPVHEHEDGVEPGARPKPKIRRDRPTHTAGTLEVGEPSVDLERDHIQPPLLERERMWTHAGPEIQDVSAGEVERVPFERQEILAGAKEELGREIFILSQAAAQTQLAVDATLMDG